MYITVTNPFTAGGSLTLTYASQPGDSAITPVVKNFPLKPATNSTTPSVAIDTLPLTGKEIRALLGSKVNATFNGTTAPGSLAATPTQKITTTSRMQLSLAIKGSN
jgi:hypothetical protein